MKISLKVEYACRVLAQLSNTYGNTQLPHIEDLAQAEDVPANYLVQILNELRNGGLIISRRGKQGGYALAKPANDITVADIVRAIDGELLGITTEPGGKSGANVQRVWLELARGFEEAASSYTVEHFRQAGSHQMYFI